jgi:hypothetical protein
MPELGPDSPLIDKPETEQPTNYEQSVKTSREGLARLFDTASEAGESPLQQLLDDLQNNEGANYIYGGQKVDDLVIRLQSLTWSDKESFIDAVLEVINPDFDLESVKQSKIEPLQSKVIDLQIRLDAATKNNLVPTINALNLEITSLKAEIARIEAL